MGIDVTAFAKEYGTLSAPFVKSKPSQVLLALETPSSPENLKN
jgi:hypothetical protein